MRDDNANASSSASFARIISGVSRPGSFTTNLYNDSPFLLRAVSPIIAKKLSYSKPLVRAFFSMGRTTSLYLIAILLSILAGVPVLLPAEPGMA